MRAIVQFTLNQYREGFIQHYRCDMTLAYRPRYPPALVLETVSFPAGARIPSLDPDDTGSSSLHPMNANTAMRQKDELR